MSEVSPLNVIFNNLKGTGSEVYTNDRIKKGKSGSDCPQGFLKFNTDFTERPICVASREYQKKKLEQIDNMDIKEDTKQALRSKVTQKTCICSHLGNGALIALGIKDEQGAPQCICPGPNIAWFDKYYSLKEMVDYIYGRNTSLVSSKRPHMFATEIIMYVDYFKKLIVDSTYKLKELKILEEFKNNLEQGMDFCLEIAKKKPYKMENLSSISIYVERERARLISIYDNFIKKLQSSESAELAETS